MILRSKETEVLPDRIALGAHKPIWETGECVSCGSAPCGPHPDFLICGECQDDWPCAVAEAVAEELVRLAHEVDSTSTRDDDLYVTAFKAGQRWFKGVLRARAEQLRGES
jgi:hypothetical protein